MSSSSHPGSRHARQARFAPIGEAGQGAIRAAHVAVVGCGALGSVASEMLVRAGVGRITLIDRDVLELSNLHRQSLFTEADVASGLPKAVAAAARLRALDAEARVDACVEDLDGLNALSLLGDSDVVLDGSDNFEARHLVNEACLELERPWVHAACLGALAVAWPIVPGGACFACAVPETPAPGEMATCESAGVIGSAVHLAAAVQVAETLKLLVGDVASLLPGAWTWDAWANRGAVARVARDPGCSRCVLGERVYLGRARRTDVVACGRGAVQLAAASQGRLDLDALAGRLAQAEGLVSNRWLVRFEAEGHALTVFRDGRVLVSGTREPAEARALAARWLG